jgi:cysteine-rich repeat protein
VGEVQSICNIDCNALSCGDGILDFNEVCDDGNAVSGDGCRGDCQGNEICGDGKLDASNGESCDDGNTINADCCDNNCQAGAGCEIEPNNTAAQALSSQGSSSPDVNITAALSPVADIDFFSFTVDATVDLRIETFSGVGNVCVGIDTEIQLQNAAGVLLAADDDGGISTCSLLNPNIDPEVTRLAPGSYLLRVNEFNNNNVIPFYRATITITALCGDGTTEGSEVCDDGNLNNGDGCQSNCTP